MRWGSFLGGENNEVDNDNKEKKDQKDPKDETVDKFKHLF